MSVQWIEESPGTVGQRITNFARATPSFAVPGGATRVQTSPSFPGGDPFVPRAVAPIFTRAAPVTVTWSFTVNNFSSSGNLELGPGEDPLARACEWVKGHVPPGMSVTIDGWKVKANGYWEKVFTFTTDAAFWAKDCKTWAASQLLAGPPSIGLPYEDVARMQEEAGDPERARQTLLLGRLTDYVRSIGGEMLGASPPEICLYDKVWRVVGGNPESPSLKFVRYPTVQDRAFLRPQSLGALGQTADWTNVPRPPYWEYTKLPWPPTGALPTAAPPGWELLANVPAPPGYTGTWPPPWPPEPPPNWPEGWPWPLPDAPAPTPPNSLPTPPAQAQPPLPPVPNATAAKKTSAVGPILIGVGLLALAGIALASSSARKLEENPCCPVCGGGS